MNRKGTREAVMKLLFQVMIRKQDYMEIIEELKQIDEQEKLENSGNELLSGTKKEVDIEGINLEELDMEFALTTLKGIQEHLEEIDNKIQDNLVKWKLNRLANIDRTILRIATYEIMFNEEIPNKVSINEAIELAKKYADDKSPAFINAVLDKVSKIK